MKKCDFSSKAKCWKNKSWGFYCDCVGLSVKCGKRGLLVWHSRTLYAIPSSIQSVGKKRRWYLAGRGRRLVAQCIVPCLPPARIHFDSFVTSFGPLPHESRVTTLLPPTSPLTLLFIIRYQRSDSIFHSCSLPPSVFVVVLSALEWHMTFPASLKLKEPQVY